MIYVYSDIIHHCVVKLKAGQLWNRLPNELKLNQDISSFKRQLKHIL